VSASDDRPRYGRLDDAERQRRPAVIRRLTFEDLARPGAHIRDTSHLVPIESVQAGDEQVFAARGARIGEPTIDLDPLADYPSVRSVVASTEIRARRALPNVRELLLLGETLVPHAETLGNLPQLTSVWVAWSQGRRLLQAEALPEGLQQLGVCRHHLRDGAPNRPRFSELARYAGLLHLTLDHCWQGDSIAPIAALQRLKRLQSNAPAGWSSLRVCHELEVVSASPRIANLRSLRTWTKLRDLTLLNSGVRGLAGLEAFTSLERLRLVLVNADRLTPLRGLPRLADVELVGLQRLHDVTDLGSLPSLRRLAVTRAGFDFQDIVHIDSLRPLSAARRLEELVLEGTIVDDQDLAPLSDLPALRRVTLFGIHEKVVEALRRSRPDIEVTWRPPVDAPGERVGVVFLRPPTNGLPRWWIREDLTKTFRMRTNAEAEARLRVALAREDPALPARVNFDTEADAVYVDGPIESDLRTVAHVIERIARKQR